MLNPNHTGSRVRQRRTALGRKQADLARAIGISASYLNLIEHNRRGIGGGLLNAIARELQVEPGELVDGVSADLARELRNAADGHAEAMLEIDRLEEFVGQFPGWSALLAQMNQREKGLEHTIETLSDRLTHDPFLSASLHDVLSTVTAIRSTASILAETPDLNQDWLSRFHRNLNDDGERLARGAEALVRYLDEGGEARKTTGATPADEFDAFLKANQFHFAVLEDSDDVAEILQAAPDLVTSAGHSLAETYLQRYVQDRSMLPLDAFAQAARTEALDPAKLALQFGVDLLTVFRRLATIPKERLGFDVGLVLCDGSGTLTYRKSLTGFSLPRFGAACPLWPLYQALARPGTALHQVVEIAERTPQRFITYAACQTSLPAGFSGPEVRSTAMMFFPVEALPSGYPMPGGQIALAGPSCRICPRVGCVARREPSVLNDAF
ncbi:MAG: short-chain fatty acyl-CoA regulator family protein [Pseudomonadota bacterium]